MDNKVTLTAGQIEELKYFIRTRGFVQPVQIQEILDHFACKVEELLEQEPSLPFHQAMKQAHHSFGINGFRPVIKELDNTLSRTYRQVYWQGIKDCFLSVKRILPIILFGIFGYQFSDWCELSGLNKEWDMNVAANLLMVCFLLFHLLISVKTETLLSKENNYYIPFSNVGFSIFPFAFLPSFFYQPVAYLQLMNIFLGICYSYLLVSSIATYHTKEKAVADHEEFLKLES